MKFQTDLGAENDGASIEATPTELDGFPLIEKLTLSRALTNLSPDRCTVAAVLAFAPFLSGQQIFQNQFSSLTAELCQRLLAPGWTHYSPLHPSNVPIPRGNREVALRLNSEDKSSAPELRLLPDSGGTGVRYEPNSVIVTTNAVDMDTLSGVARTHPSRASLAVAVLLAEDLDVANYIISKRTANEFCITRSVIELLNAVSIGIRVEDE